MIAGVDGRIAIVGGSSSGLGYAVAELLAQSGARVMVVSRSEERVAKAVKNIRSAGGASVEGCAADFTDERRACSGGGRDLAMHSAGRRSWSPTAAARPECRRWRRRPKIFVRPLSSSSCPCRGLPSSLCRRCGHRVGAGS